jgi:hypothetical protein
MFTVACLETAIAGEKWNPPRLKSLAADMEFSPLRVEIDSAEKMRARPVEDPQEWLRKAGAFYLRNGSIISNSSSRDEIAKEISSGKRLLVSLDPNKDKLGLMNLLLEKYGIKATSFGIFRGAEDVPERDRPQDFELIRDVDPACFRDAALFNGVDSLKLSSPLLIDYSGRAFPTLVLPEKGSRLIDKETDLPEYWTARELACVVSFHELNSTGAVLAYAGSLFTDSLLGSNKAFAANLLWWLKQGARTEPSPGDTEPSPSDHLVRQIETNLLKTVQSILGRNFEDWWRNAVPEPIRVECSARHERTKTILPKHAYLDLLDYKKIMEYNWDRFETVLYQAGWKGGKQKALAWLDRLNDIRNILAHPTRAYFSGPLPRDDRVFLEECFTGVLLMLTHRPTADEQN